MALMLVLLAFIPSSLAPSTLMDAASLQLTKLQFLNRGTIISNPRGARAAEPSSFEYHPQCGSATEDIHAFKAGSNYSYLWARAQQPQQRPPANTTEDGKNGGESKSKNKKHAAPVLTTPPVGMRSGVPLGGFGTGTVELRADGTFKEYLLENGGPGLSHTFHASSFAPAKVDADELFVAVYARPAGNRPGPRTGAGSGTGGARGAAAPAQQTQPPYAAVLRANAPQLGSSSSSTPEVAGLNYSGAYPVARLAVVDAAAPVGVVMHAYSPLQLYNATASGVPAIAFSVVFTNPATNSDTVDVSKRCTNAALGAGC